MSAKPAFEPTLRSFAAQARHVLDEHPTPKILVDYHAGDLPADQEEKLRDHLALCHECADLLLDLVTFADFTPPEETAALANSEVEAAWQKVQPRLVAKEPGEGATVLEMPRRAAETPRARRSDAGSEVVAWQRKMRVVYALAATLLVGVVGLSVWGFSLKRQVHESVAPQANPASVDAISLRESTRGDKEKEEAVVPGENRFFLWLHPSLPPELTEFPQYPDYAVEIREARSKRPVISLGGLLLKDGRFSLDLPGASFSPGVYLVDLYGVNKDRREKIDTLTFQIAAH